MHDNTDDVVFMLVPRFYRVLNLYDFAKYVYNFCTQTPWPSCIILKFKHDITEKIILNQKHQT